MVTTMHMLDKTNTMKTSAMVASLVAWRFFTYKLAHMTVQLMYDRSRPSDAPRDSAMVPRNAQAPLGVEDINDVTSSGLSSWRAVEPVWK